MKLEEATKILEEFYIDSFEEKIGTDDLQEALTHAIEALKENEHLLQLTKPEILPLKETIIKLRKEIDNLLWVNKERTDLETELTTLKDKITVERIAEIVWDEIQVALQKVEHGDEIEEILVKHDIDNKTAQAIVKDLKGEKNV